MKPILLLTLVALTGCATTRGEEGGNPAPSASYTALSHDPFWTVAVAEDAIVMTRGPEGGRADGELTSVVYRGAVPREEGGVRRWESAEGTMVITVEARPAPCTTGGRSYPDRVTIRLSGLMLEGCGGQEISQ